MEREGGELKLPHLEFAAFLLRIQSRLVLIYSTRLSRFVRCIEMAGTRSGISCSRANIGTRYSPPRSLWPTKSQTFRFIVPASRERLDSTSLSRKPDNLLFDECMCTCCDCPCQYFSEIRNDIRDSIGFNMNFSRITYSINTEP